MAINYTGFAFPKASRGAAVLAKEADDAKEEKRRLEVRKEVRRRDVTCIWPEAHKCRKGLECAHVKDASLGGEYESGNLVLVCGWIHRRGPESIHGKELKIEVDTPRGAWGPRSFWRQTGEFDALGQPVYHCIVRETERGVVERD